MPFLIGTWKWRVEKRASKHPGATIRRDVIRDELLSIRKMFIYAKKRSFAPRKRFHTGIL